MDGGGRDKAGGHPGDFRGLGSLGGVLREPEQRPIGRTGEGGLELGAELGVSELTGGQAIEDDAPKQDLLAGFGLPVVASGEGKLAGIDPLLANPELSELLLERGDALIDSYGHG